MEQLIQKAIEKNASDVFFVADAAPTVRVDGVIVPLEKKAVTNKQIREYFTGLMTPAQKAAYEQEQDVDMRAEIGGSTLRLNVHQQRGGMGVAVRIFPKTIPTPSEIGLGETIVATTRLRNGLVLVTGPAGVGKSTTIASLLQTINETTAKHIITVEDPIEFIFENNHSFFEQREVRVDTPSFASALKYVLRQNPDVLFIGEMRDPVSVAAALTAAETGHVVFSTLHTPSAADTVERIIDMFPPEKQRQILIQLASVLRVVVSQTLVPLQKGGLVAAREILVNTPAVSNLIRNNNIAQIQSAIQTGRKDGMMTMETALKQLRADDLIA